MTKIALALVFVLLQQDELRVVKIPKQERPKYLTALKKFKEAVGQLDGTPETCMDTATVVIEDKTIDNAKLECMIRIQDPDGVYSEAELFTPYQLRGRARLKRAGALGSKAKGDAILMAQEAKKDFEISVARGNKGSADFAKEADTLISRLKEPDTVTQENPKDRKAAQLVKDLRDFLATKPSPEDGLKRCDAIAADIAGSKSENEFKLIRGNLERDLADSRKSVGEVEIKAVRDFLDRKPGPRDIVARCEKAEAILKGTEWESELKLIKDKALREIADAERGRKEELIKSLRELVSGGASPDDILKKCDEVGPVLAGSPWERELGLIREKADRDKKALAEGGAAEKAIAAIRTLAAAKGDLTELIAKCDEAATTLSGTAFDGELKLIRDRAVTDRKERFQGAWMDLAILDKYKSARQVIDRDGTFLTEAEMKKVVGDLDAKCARFVDIMLSTFRNNLRAVFRPENAFDGLAKMAAAAFDKDFAVPDGAELIGAWPALDWARNFRGRMARWRGASDPRKLPMGEFLGLLADVRDAAEGAQAIDEPGVNEHFRAAESLAQNLAWLRLDAIRDESHRADKSRRDELRADAGKIIGEVKALHEASRVRPERRKEFLDAHGFLPGHLARLEKILDDFPVDAAQVGEIAAKLSDWQKLGGAPHIELELCEKDLLRLHTNKSLRLTVESRRTLTTNLLTAAVLKHLLAGVAPDDIKSKEDVLIYAKAAWSSEVGEPAAADLAKFGPKVKKILESLKP